MTRRRKPPYTYYEDGYEFSLADERIGGRRAPRRAPPHHGRRHPEPPPSPAKTKRKGRTAARMVSISLVLLLTGVIYLTQVSARLPAVDTIFFAAPSSSVVFLDVEGREIARRGPVAGKPVKVEELPGYLIDAVIAIEDKRFFSHNGVDARGMIRAALANMRAGEIVQGGSTITQQLVKNLYLDGRRTFDRKAREALIAFRLEARFSKEEILEAYLNQVYFGGGAYGVDAAARRYFAKPATQVTLGEAALLAGLLKAPSRYSPSNDAERASVRATLVLDMMMKRGVISVAQREAVLDDPVRVRANGDNAFASHFIDWALPRARGFAAGVEADLVVRTTLNLSVQAAAELAVMEVMDAEADGRNASEAALMAIDADGAIRAMVGGRSYADSPFNRAVQARRQPGSAFKPFVYAAAMEAGLSPWSMRSDAPITVGDWTPANYKDEYEGDLALAAAMAESVNTVAVRVSEEVGRDRVARLAGRVGFDTRIRPLRAIALGVEEVSLQELTGAYLPFANHGYRAPVHGLQSVETLDGEVLWERSNPPLERVLANRPRRLMNLMLSRVVTEGTGQAAALPGRPAAGKTGTTNEFRDAWFVGYTPGFVAGVWVGNDNGAPMEGVTGGALPARIWRSFMIRALAGTPVRPLEMPIEERPIMATLQGPEPISEEMFVTLAGQQTGEP